MDRRLGFSSVGLFLLSGSIILYQIVLTRLCAIMMWHHFSYLVVSIALLGFGAAGSLLTARRDSLRAGPPTPTLVLFSAGYGLAVVLAFFFATTVRIDTLRITEEPSNLAALLLLLLIFTGPMLLGGLAVGQALTRMARHVNRLYFADLMGAAAGAALSVLLLGRLDVAACMMIAGGIGAAAAVFFGLGGRSRHIILSLLALLFCAYLAAAFAGGSPALGIASVRWPVPFAPEKEFASFARKGQTAARLPSATAEVEISSSHKIHGAMGGDFGVLDRVTVAGRFVAQDGSAPTMLYKKAADFSAFPFLDDAQAGSAYVAFEAAGHKKPKVLVIGAGGGIDAMIALVHDARDVTAVDVNAAMISMSKDLYAEYLGGLFTPGAHAFSNRLRLLNREGRAYLRHGAERFDVIQMSGVDSFTALSTGAYTQAEAYLYTTDAVKDFYAHLAPGGYINYSRFILTWPKKPRETLRLANIARAALAELGVKDPASSIAVFQGRSWASTMVKRGAFSRAEIRALQEFGRKEGFQGLVFNPLWDPGRKIQPRAQPLALAREYARLECAPLLHPLLRDSRLESRIFDLFAQAYLEEFGGRKGKAEGLLGRIEALFPADQRKKVRPVLEGMLASYTAMGSTHAQRFAETRNIFLELMRGTPKQRRAFLEAYEYDVTPCSDDNPFFFNYYKYRQLFEHLGGNNSRDMAARRYHPDFPVGHAVLLASLAQVLLLGVLLILAPLQTLKRHGIKTSGRWRYLCYFGALGLGFMLIEIVLMQKLVVFLGHPTYALSVVLSALLGSAGIGSLWSGRLRKLGRPALLLLMLAVVGMIGLEFWLVGSVLPELLSWSFPARVSAAVAAILPLGLVLGMPFPTGIRILKKNSPQLLPWGWAINGFTSVAGSILCIILSRATGFSRVFWIAAAIYALGFLAMKPAAGLEEASASSSP